MKRIDKQPDEVISIKVDFAPWLATLAVPAVIDSVATGCDAGLHIVDADILAGGIVEVRVRGGEVGVAYNLAVDAITDTELVKRKDYRIGIRGPAVGTIVDLGNPDDDDDLLDGGGP
jgi:hypothetical protein